MAIAEALMSTPDRKRRMDDQENVPEVANRKLKIYTPPKPVHDKRYDGYDHWPTIDEIASPRSCQLESCKSRTRTRCTKCDQYLCLSKDKDCFRLFHLR